MSNDVLLQDRDGPVAILTMNRPQTKNALNQELVLALGDALTRAMAEPGVRAVVLTGAGGSFSSGADLRASMTGDDDRPMDRRIDDFHRLIHAIVNSEKPAVAAVEGPAVGFGADLALACDLRVLSETGYIQEKFVKIGLMPDGGGTFWMPRLVGLGRAMEYLLLGTRIDGALAYDVGLANRVVPPGELLETAMKLAHDLALGPPLALGKIRQAVRRSFTGGIDEALTREKTGQLELLASEDLQEGIVAWAQRREPNFKGK